MGMRFEDDLFIAAAKGDLRERGYLVRYTEWLLGHQVVLHPRATPLEHVIVTPWCETERLAWNEALALASVAVPPGPEADRPLQR
jgi:hypothetical protein